MACRMGILKTALAVLNSVLPLLGIGLIALSVYELNSSTPGTMQHIAIVVQIFIGSFVVLTSFLGCFGLCRESLSLTWSYAICMLILLAFQIYIIAVASATDYVQNATDNFNALWANHSVHAAQIAEIEQKHSCCGKTGAPDYVLLGKAIPEDCYENRIRNASNLFTDSCLEALQRQAKQSGKTGLIIKTTLFAAELVGLCLASVMAMTIRNNRRREEFKE